MMCRNHLWTSIEGWGLLFMEITQPMADDDNENDNDNGNRRVGSPVYGNHPTLLAHFFLSFLLGRSALFAEHQNI